MSSGSTQSKQLSWLEFLRNTYPDRVEDCFAGTEMCNRAKTLGAGLWLVRGAVTGDQLNTWNDELHLCLNDIAQTSGTRAIALKGSVRWYDTIQCVAGSCTCKYSYEGTAKHKTYALKNLHGLNEITKWLHSKMQVPHEKQFNEIVCNRYLKQLDEFIPWHSDVVRNVLLAPDAEVLSLTMGHVGAFCWHYNEKDDFTGKARKRSIESKERGVVFLLPGDLLLTEGCFQKRFRHKTLPYSRLLDPELANTYTGSNNATWSDFDCMQTEHQEGDRICVTWRRIVNHHLGCPELPAPEQSPTSAVSHQRSLPPARSPPPPPAQSPIAPVPRFCPPAGPAPLAEVPAPAIPTLVIDPHEIQPTLMLSTVKQASEFIKFVDSVADNMEEYLENCPTDLSAAFEKLRIRHREVVRAKALGELSVDVHNRLLDLSRYGGSKKAFNTMEPPSDHTPFTRGACGSGNSTSCRVVVPLRVAEMFFKNADLDRYITQEALVSIPATSLAGIPVYFLQDGYCKPKTVADFDPDWAQFRVFELPLNYESTMQRYSLNGLPKQEGKPHDEIIRGYLAAWWALLVQEKRRHHPSPTQSNNQNELSLCGSRFLEYCVCFGHLIHNEGHFGEHEFQNHIQSVRDYLGKKGGV
jgi:hypothetical protein